LASWLDDLDSLMKEIKAHPGEETLFSAIPAATGAFMLSRPYWSSLGTRLGALVAIVAANWCAKICAPTIGMKKLAIPRRRFSRRR
jgi:hypothetical protein